MNSTISERNHVCSYRHAFSLNNVLRRLIQPPVKIIGEYIQPGDTVMDIGCGPGFFTFPMADLVGDNGKVVAIDLQPEMLDKISRKLNASEKRIVLHKSKAETLGLASDVQADFILAYYMVHETPDQLVLFTEIKQHLKSGGEILVVEPPFHVNKKEFAQTMLIAEKAGLRVVEKPKKKGGMSALLTSRT